MSETAPANVAAFVDGWLARELEDIDTRPQHEIASSLRGLREAIRPAIVGTVVNVHIDGRQIARAMTTHIADDMRKAGVRP